MKRALWLLTRVSRQRVVGRRPAGQSEALRSLAAGASPARPLRRFDLGAELGPDDPEQHDGGGLLATLLVRVGDFLGVGRQVGQAAWWRERGKGLVTPPELCHALSHSSGRTTLLSCIFLTVGAMRG